MVKVLLLSAISALAAATGFGQPDSDPPVTIIKHEWRSKLALGYSRAEKDPFETTKETQRDIQQRRDALKREEQLRERGLPAENPPVRKPRAEGKPHGPAIQYYYSVTLRNDAPKKIKTVVWEYLFIDRETKEVAGRRSFIKDIKIGSRSKRTITMLSQIPPTGTINASTIGKEPSELYLEQVRIQRLDYSDGTTWQAKPIRASTQ